MVRKHIIISTGVLWALLLAAAGCSDRKCPVSAERAGKVLESASPGDTIILKDGDYADLDLRWRGRGTADNPVVVMPRTPGGAQFSGESSLHISGTGLEVSGLLFKGCTASSGAIVEFRDGDSLARHCRMHDCVLDDCNPASRQTAYSYVHLYGRFNSVDHCSLLGKLNLGVTLIVMLNYDGCDENFHNIDHNIFGPRPVYGSNGAETIRVGTSHQCMQNSRSRICDNLFLRCNGEVEVVSIKSSENLIARNDFYECEGVLALRHGDRNVAQGNRFFGHGKRNTGGIRIVGEDQKVLGNLFQGLAGDRFFSALALMYGVPNSLPNRYMQVKNTLIEGNTFAACKSIEFNTGEDFERTLPPAGTLWKDNTVCPQACAEEPSLEELAAGRGAKWYDWSPSPDRTSGKILNASPSGALATLVEEAPAGSTLLLEDGLYVLERALVIDKPLEIRAADGASPRFVFKGRSKDNFITIADGGEPVLRGLSFSGEAFPGYSLASAIVTTAPKMIRPYSLTIEDCSFSNCGESGFVPVKGGKGTFATSVTLRNCHFSALSGDAVNFAAETEDKGRYNADDMLIEGCHFERILGIPVNIRRGGSDESTAGPYVTVRDCSFDDCCNKVRGSVLQIIGAQVLEISSCRFNASGRGGYSIRLDEAPWEKITLKGNRFFQSGPILKNGR